MVGVIGRNGAGKTTLLKILSRITEPTDGRVDHQRPRRQPAGSRHRLPPGADRPREYLSQRRDPRHEPRRRSARKFDEIVAFAEVEKFLDTPVKRYSSGMYVRLAFAVAAHLEPEILYRRRGAGGRRRRISEKMSWENGRCGRFKAVPWCSGQP